MRVGAYQCVSPAGDISKGLSYIDAALTQAAAADIDMLVMPELFLPGYAAVSTDKPAGWDGVTPKVRALCIEHKVALTIGLPDYAGSRIYNTALAIFADGAVLANCSKVQLFGPREQRLFTPGDQLNVFDYMGTWFGLMICYDIEFPEYTRALVRAGATVILTPTVNMMPFINVCSIQVPGRVMEYGVTIVYANYTGAEGDLIYTGNSLIAGPDGYDLAKSSTKKALLAADIPFGLCDSNIPLSTQLADYRAAKVPAP